MIRRTVVIGAGLSGLMSALALAEAGCRPLVLAKGQGITHWISGTIDMWGQTNGQSLQAALANLIDAQPNHPYALVGMDNITSALARFRTLMQDARYPYVGSLEQNVLLPTAMGALRPTALLPATMAAGDMRQPGELLIAGFHELRDFFPPLAAANLRSQGHAARGVYLTVPQAHRRLDYSTRAFAHLFDNADFRAEIGRQLREARGSATRIGLPAVLGLRDPTGVVADLQRSTGAQVFEIPTLPPSIPGMRLFTIFQQAIVAAGGRMQVGSEVMQAKHEQQRITTLFTEAAARPQEHRVEWVVLATGGIAGGGIVTNHRGDVHENALGLPLRAPESRAGWFAGKFLHPEGHPIFTAGVPVNGQFQPLDRNGTVVYDNVVVTGSAIASSDPIHDRSITGIAVTTGWRAGHMLAEHALAASAAPA